MMGERTVAQEALFYSFNIERHVPANHLLRSIDRFVDLSAVRDHLRPYYSETGRPSIDPELMIRMLIIGYCMGIRSERRLCEEVDLNLAYRWFCRLGLEGDVPDHSTFSKNRHGRFRDSDLLRKVFEMTVRQCIAEKLVGGEGFAVDASLIRADVSRPQAVLAADGLPPGPESRAVREYLEALDDAAFGDATPVEPKYLAPSDPASRFTAATHERAFFAYSTNYLIDLEHAVIVDVEATTAIRQAEILAQRRTIERTQDRFDLWPARLAADTAYGSAENLAWLVEERGIETHIPVFDKSARRDGTLERGDFSHALALSGSRAAALVAELAPMIRRRRKLRSPIFVVRPNRSLPPLECCLGTRPSQAAKSRPRRKVTAAGAKGTSAVAMTGPTPGMVISLFATGSVLARLAISRSRRAICDWSTCRLSVITASTGRASAGMSDARSPTISTSLPTCPTPCPTI